MSVLIPYATLILRWYDQHQRTLPWRAKAGTIPEPYHVLLSEIMLQQTQVATVIPYFNKFIANFPTLNDLAKAPTDLIMTLWTGLGYYSRARNLHRCAQEIAQQGGIVPKDYNALKALPGIGDYTASAILSIGYNLPYVPVDGNVERVTARLFAVQDSLPKAKPKLAELAKTLNHEEIAIKRPGDFAQALFDIGATICKPKNPLCLICPLSEVCEGYKQQIADQLPVRQKKAIKPTRYGVSFYAENEEQKVLFHKRPDKGVLAGTMELPSSVWVDHPIPYGQALKEVGMDGHVQEIGQIKHVFTHFTLLVRLYRLKLKMNGTHQEQDHFWYDRQEVMQYPCSSLMKKMITYCEKVQSKNEDENEDE